MIFLLNHLWQSTIFAAVAGLLAAMLKQNRAALRYRIWLIASAKFLIPFSILVAFGSHVGWRTGATPVDPAISSVVDEVGGPLVAPAAGLTAADAAVHRQTAIPLSYALLAIWLCGFVLIGISWWRKWSRIRAAVRAASPLDLGNGVTALSTPALLEPGIFGIRRPVLLLPEGIMDHLGAEHVDAIVAHEQCHLRRRDNPAAALHMIVEAVFWFHPMVWWIGSRLREERERACDEEVLALGKAREIYAESILKTCQFYLEAPLECMSGVTGADLKSRIQRIMTGATARRLNAGKRLLLGAAGIAAVAVPVIFGLINAPQGRAQSQGKTDGAPPIKFEVASIRKSDPNSRRTTQMVQPGGRFEATNDTLARLIMFAYDVSPRQLLGGPEWMRSDKYDVVAKPDGAVPVGTPSSSAVHFPQGDGIAWTQMNRGGRGAEDIRQMVQALLAERFQLKAHRETRELPLYALVVAKNGPKLKESAEGRRPQMGVIGLGQLSFQAQDARALAMTLATLTGRFIEDRTGLQGKYDFDLHWTPDESERQMMNSAAQEHNMDLNNLPRGDSSGPSLFTALEEQLGLRLESGKGPVEVVVVDHAEKPTEN